MYCLAVCAPPLPIHLTHPLHTLYTPSKVDAEHAASIIDGAIITTGGGFSAVAPQPAWQKDAVGAWDTGAPSAAKPPKSMYVLGERSYIIVYIL